MHLKNFFAFFYLLVLAIFQLTIRVLIKYSFIQKSVIALLYLGLAMAETLICHSNLGAGICPYYLLHSLESIPHTQGVQRE